MRQDPIKNGAGFGRRQHGVVSSFFGNDNRHGILGIFIASPRQKRDVIPAREHNEFFAGRCLNDLHTHDHEPLSIDVLAATNLIYRNLMRGFDKNNPNASRNTSGACT